MIQFGTCGFVPIPFFFTQEPMNYRKISQATGAALFCSMFVRNQQNYIFT